MKLMRHVKLLRYVYVCVCDSCGYVVMKLIRRCVHAHMKTESLSTTEAPVLKGSEYPLWMRYWSNKETFLSSLEDT